MMTTTSVFKVWTLLNQTPIYKALPPDGVYSSEESPPKGARIYQTEAGVDYWLRLPQTKPPSIQNLIQDNPKVKQVINVLQEHGTPYLVGGGVRDTLLGRGSKDIDIEVHGISIDKLSNLISSELGSKADQVGKQFGVFKIGDIDISVPRTETKTGYKHTDFDVQTETSMPLKDAAKRRDFTMNALMYDVGKDKLLDFFGGEEDIKSGVIKHVDDKTFVEDPLRVYRAAQFASRFGFSIDPSTQQLAKSMDLSNLPRERLFEEFSKMFLKSSHPSIGLQALDDMGVLEREFPELHELKDTHQRDDYHAEGDVFTHTKMVLDKASIISKRFSNEKDKQIIMLAALCHDLGKPSTTDEKGSAIGHSEAGIDITKTFLDKLTTDKEIINTVSDLVEHHLLPVDYHRNKASDKAFRRIINKHGTKFLSLLTAVSEADSTGRLHKQPDGSSKTPTNEPTKWFSEQVKRVSSDVGITRGRLTPLVSGNDLKNLGFTEGKELGDILREIQEHHEEGHLKTKGDALQYIQDKYPSSEVNKLMKFTILQKALPPNAVYSSEEPPPKDAVVYQTEHGKDYWVRPTQTETQQAGIDFKETLKLPEITQEQKSKSSLKFPNLESVAGLIDMGEKIPRYWSHKPPGTLGPSKEGGIQAYKISGHRSEVEAISEKFKDGSDQKIIWLQSPANPNDPYLVDASKLNLANVGSETSGFQHAGNIPPEAVVKGLGKQATAKEKTARPWPTTKVGTYVLNTVDKDSSILDFGSGYGTQTTRLRNEGFNKVTAYDTRSYGEDSPTTTNPDVLDEKYDVVMASNVLNVQEDDENLDDAINTMISTLADNGKVIANFPNTPRKHKDFQNGASMEDKLNSHFNVVKRVGGSKAEPIFELSNPNTSMTKSWYTNPRGAKDPHGKRIRKEGDGGGAFGESGGVAFTSTDSGIFTPTHSERERIPKKKKRSGVDRLADFLVDDSPERKMEKTNPIQKFLPLLVQILPMIMGSKKASKENKAIVKNTSTNMAELLNWVRLEMRKDNDKHFHQQSSGETINNQPPRIDWAKGNKKMPREDGMSEFDGKPDADAAISQKDEERRIRRLKDSDDKADDEPKSTGAASQAAPAGLNIQLGWESGGGESDALHRGSSKDKEKGEVEDPNDEHGDEEFITNKYLKQMIKEINEA